MAEPIAEFGLGRVAAAAGRHEEGARHFARAIALFPEFGAAHYALPVRRALGKTEESKRALERHQQYGARWPAFDDPLLAESRRSERTRARRCSAASSSREAGDVAGAIAHEAALKTLIRVPGAQAHVELITLWTGVRRIGPRRRSTIARPSRSGLISKRRTTTTACCSACKTAAPRPPPYCLALDVNPSTRRRATISTASRTRSEVSRRGAEYQQVVEVMPTFRLARFNLGRMLIILGRPRDAVVQLERLDELRDAEAPRYSFALATAKIHAGQRDDGVKWAREAATGDRTRTTGSGRRDRAIWPRCLEGDDSRGFVCSRRCSCCAFIVTSNAAEPLFLEAAGGPGASPSSTRTALPAITTCPR